MSEKQAKCQSKDQKKRKIFIGGIAKTVTEPMLYSYFSNFGKVERAVVNREHYTDKSRGSGFVLFQSEDSAQRVLGFARNHVLEGKQFDCQPCLLREEIKKGKPSLTPNKKIETSSSECSNQSANQLVCPPKDLPSQEERESWTYSRYPSLRTGSGKRMLYKYDYYPSHEEIPFKTFERRRNQQQQPKQGQCYIRPCDPYVINSEEGASHTSPLYVEGAQCYKNSQRPCQTMYQNMLYQQPKPKNSKLAKTSLIVKVGKTRPNSSNYQQNYVFNFGREAKLPEGFQYSESKLSKPSFNVLGERSAPFYKRKEESRIIKKKRRRTKQSHRIRKYDQIFRKAQEVPISNERSSRQLEWEMSDEWDFHRIHSHCDRNRRRKKKSCYL